MDGMRKANKGELRIGILKGMVLAKRHVFYPAMARRMMMGIVAVVLLTTCGERVPEGVIPSKKMPDVLVDVHMADGMLSMLPLDSARKKIHAYYDAIFQQYGIDSTILHNSVTYYTRRPHIMKDIYIEVERRLNRLEREEQAAITEKYRLQREADSISNARKLDSLFRVTRDSADYKRMRHLLFVHDADSTYDQADSVTYEKLAQRMFEEIRFNKIYGDRLPFKTFWQGTVPADTASGQQETVPIRADGQIDKTDHERVQKPLERIGKQ